jgi:hypothetical protein
MHDYSPFYSPFGPLVFALAPFVLLIALWTIVIKGYALWVAARAGQKWWFIALLVINTIGILEVVYLIWFSPKGSNKLNSHFSHASADQSSTQA